MSANVPRRLRVVLAVSLGLNVLIVGLLIGLFLRAGDTPGRVAVTPEFRRLIDALPPATRETFRADLRDMARQRREPRAERLRAARAFADALMQDPMDRAAIETLWSDRQQAGDAVRDAAQQALLDRLGALTQAQRAEILENLRETVMRRGAEPREGAPNDRMRNGPARD